MTVKLVTSTSEATGSIENLEKRLSDIESLEWKIQFFIAELVIIRLFSIVEENIAATAYKIACGATYVNAAQPRLLVPKCKSLAEARTQMEAYNRARPIRLCWSILKDIKTATEHIIDPNDYFIRSVSNYGQLINDMRKVRNYAAHGNKSARVAYREVVKTTYGVHLNLTLGAFLLSTKRHDKSNLSRYLISSKILLNDISKGS